MATEQRLRAEAAEETRRRILDALYRRLQEAASSPVSMEEIARAARVARSTVYLAFGSRAGMFDALARRLIEGAGYERLVEAVLHPDAREHLRGGLRGGVEMDAEHRDVFRVLFSPAQLDPDAVGRAIERMEETRAEGMAYLAQRLAEQGVLREDVTADEAAHVLWVLASFESFDLLFTGRGLPVDEVDGVWQRHFLGRRERDRLMLALFAYAGLRKSELLGLDWDDVDLERRLIRVRKAKGGRQRTVPIHPALEPLFLGYLRFRAADPEPALFVGVQGKRLSPTIMAQTFIRYARAAGVTERKRVTPHTLRHVFASELLRAGANLRQIQELLGHKHLDSTQRYTHVTAHELRGAVKRLQFAQCDARLPNAAA